MAHVTLPKAVLSTVKIFAVYLGSKNGDSEVKAIVCHENTIYEPLYVIVFDQSYDPNKNSDAVIIWYSRGRGANKFHFIFCR